MISCRLLNWNVRRATSSSPVWEVIAKANPAIITLQEVISIPQYIQDDYAILAMPAISKTGKHQKFKTAILVKGGSLNTLNLQTTFNWLNKELDLFSGNILSAEVALMGMAPIKITSVYSPAWPVDKIRMSDEDVTGIKLKLNKDVWCTEILWAVLRENIQASDSWIVAGDFNSSVTFDQNSGGPRGNQEIVDRMQALGFVECLAGYEMKLIPTYKNAKNGKIIHQLDHVYATANLYKAMSKAYVIDDSNVFENSLSDHLPIVADYMMR